MTNEKRQEDQDLREIMKQRKAINASKAAREKSLQAFQQGFEEAAKDKKKKQKRLQLRQRVMGSLATVTAAAVAGLLLFNTNFLQEHIFNWDETEKVEETTDPIDLLELELNEDIVNTIMDRPFFQHVELSDMRHWRIFNSQMSIPLPVGWSSDEVEEDGVFNITITGSDTEKLTLMLFTEEPAREEFDSILAEHLANWSYTDATIIPPDRMKGEFNYLMEVLPYYKDTFSFDTGTAAMYGFIDEEEGRFRELYVSKLYGMPMIYTSEYPLDNNQSWNHSWLIFSRMSVNEFFPVRGSEGEHHPDYNLPVKKTVMATEQGYFREMDIELVVIEELGVTSYLTNGTDVTRFENDHLTSWRFTEPLVSRNSFTSFGKLTENIPIYLRREILFDAYGIELGMEHEDEVTEDSAIFRYPGYMQIFDPNDNMDSYGGTYSSSGYFELFEHDGDWYYRHLHRAETDTSPRVFTNMELFLRYLEWY